ncbi:MAG: hypothetical protein UHM23_05960 [Clostridia bacterium]|nr:hypothetical protein [Clostridia bacterium]
MTIKECIDIVDNAKPNQYGIKEKVMWLSFVDETIINDVLKTHEGYDGRFDNFEGYTEDKLSVPLIVPSPYDRLYPQYIKMMIDSENGETARYNNSSALYNTYLNEYKKYYNKTHMPLNATQKIPSPVSININSHLSDAQIEYIKRQLYYMLSQDVGEVISHDKLYDIAMEYYQNNTEVLKGKDGEKGDKGEDGTKYYGFPEISLDVGSELLITFNFDEDGIDGNTGLSKQDYPGIDEWRTGDMLISANGRVLLIADIIRSGAKVNWLTVRCVSDLKGEKGDKGDIGSAIYAVNMGLPKDCKVGTDYAFELGEFIYPEGIKDGDYMIDGDSSCMFLFAELEDGGASLGGYTNRVVCVANLNGKPAEGAMVFKGAVDVLPYWANEGEVYKPKSDYVAEKQYNNPDNFSYSVDYIGESHVVMWGNLMGYFHEAYESSTSKSGYLMFYNGEYSEEFFFTIANVDDSAVYFANADQSELERVFSSPVEYFAIQDVLIVHKGTSAVYHNGEWVEL